MGSINMNDNDDQYFLWISDAHFDPHYATSAAFQSGYYTDAGCKDMAAATLGKFGCDSPRALVASALDHAVNITASKSPAFVIVSGDSIRHGVDQLFTEGDFHEGGESRSKHSTGANVAVEEAANSQYHETAMVTAGEILADVITMVESAFPESEIIVSLGNNDVVPDYYLQLQDETALLGSSSLTPDSAGMLGILFNALSKNADAIATIPENTTKEEIPTETVLRPSDAWTFLRGGYYSRNVNNGMLTILSLNTVLYSSNFSPIAVNVDDPGLQFSWLRKMLKYCRDNGTQALIVGHIPPAVGSYRHTQLWYEIYIDTYYKIVKEFDDLIIGQLYGHLHSDEFRVGRVEETTDSTSNSNAMIPSMSTPILLSGSITPLHGNDPSIRVVKYGRRGDADNESQNEKFRLLDYDSHRFSFNKNSWSKLYTFSEAYSVASDLIKEEGLSSKVYHTIVESMEDERGRETPLLESYRSYRLSGADGDITSSFRGANIHCNVKCRDEMMCTFQSATRAGYDNCLLERKQEWVRRGRSIFGLVGAAVFASVMIAFLVVRCKKKSKRKEYESTPSVIGDEQGEEKDQEMI